MKYVWVAGFAIFLTIYGCSTPTPQTVAQPSGPLAIATKNNCMGCHGVDKRIIGPSFKEVSARYSGRDVQQLLFKKVRNGSSGAWGSIPQPANLQISDENLKLLIRWITEMQPGSSRESQKADSASASSAKCSVTVTQGGKEVANTSDGRARIFEMQSAPFGIQVSSSRCNPSVGTFTNDGDFRYVANSPIVISSPMFSMAGSEETQDVLHFRAENPRLIDGYDDIYKPYKKEIEELCSELGRCPQNIRAFRNYWSFAGTSNGGKAYADFNRLTVNRSLFGTRGQVLLVVYTKHRDFLDEQGHAYLQALETHPVILRFR